MARKAEVVFSAIEPQYLEEIIRGRKKYELRVAKEKFLKLRRGGYLVLFSRAADLGAILKISSVYGPQELKKIFSRINFREILPMARSIEEAFERIAAIYGNIENKKFLALKIQEVAVFPVYEIINALRKVRAI